MGAEQGGNFSRSPNYLIRERGLRTESNPTVFMTPKDQRYVTTLRHFTLAGRSSSNITL